MKRSGYSLSVFWASKSPAATPGPILLLVEAAMILWLSGREPRLADIHDSSNTSPRVRVFLQFQTLSLCELCVQ